MAAPPRSPATAVRVTRHAGADADAALAAAGHDDLLAAQAEPDPTRRLSWQSAWRRTVGAASDPLTLVARRNGDVVGVLALERVRTKGLRVVRFRGQADPWFSTEPAARDDAARTALLAAAAAERGDLLQLDGLAGGPEAVEGLRTAIPRARISEMTTWRLRPDDPPRPMRKRRKEVRRAIRRAADQGIELTTAATADAAEIRRRLPALLDFHAAHFAGEGDNKLLEPAERRRFAEEGIGALADEGAVRVVEVRTEDGTLVAFDLALFHGTSAIAYAGAFDRTRDDLPSLGWVSMLAMTDLLEGEGATVIDFGAGEAPYKALIARPATLTRALAPLSAPGRIALAARAVATKARRGGATDDEGTGDAAPAPMKVVMLIESLDGGGAERFTVGLAQELDARPDTDVVVCGSRDPGTGSGVVEHATGVRALLLGRRRTLSPLAWMPLVRYLRRERVDVLHSHMFGSNVWAVLIGRLARVPVVIATEHSWTYEGQRVRRLLDGHWIGRLSSAFVAVSPEDARRMVEIEHVPARRVRTIPTGLLRDPAELQSTPGALREELGLPEGTPLVGAIAMLRPMKAVDVLVAAFAHLRARVPDAHLVIAGDGPLRPEVEAQITALGVGDAVHLLGVREDVPNILRSLDVAVLPSDSEGSPIALIEAMVAGRAIVASRVGGMPWILDEGSCGVLVPPRSPELLAGEIADLLDDPDRRGELGERARERALGDFTIASVASHWSALYRELSGS